MGLQLSLQTTIHAAQNLLYVPSGVLHCLYGQPVRLQVEHAELLEQATSEESVPS